MSGETEAFWREWERQEIMDELSNSTGMTCLKSRKPSWQTINDVDRTYRPVSDRPNIWRRANFEHNELVFDRTMRQVGYDNGTRLNWNLSDLIRRRGC